MIPIATDGGVPRPKRQIAFETNKCNASVERARDVNIAPSPRH